MDFDTTIIEDCENISQKRTVIEPAIEGVRGNPKLRPVGVSVAYTQDMLIEYKRCMDDPVYFIKNYCKIISLDKGLVNFDLYGYQEEMIRDYHENRFSINMASRQSGKCLIYNTILKVRQKSTGKIVEIMIGDFYRWKKFKTIPIEVAIDFIKSSKHFDATV